MEIQYLDFNEKNWQKYKKFILEWEELLFLEDIQITESEFEEIFENEYVGEILLIDTKPVGFILASKPIDKKYGISQKIKKILYIDDIIIEPSYQGKGLGFEMLKHFLNNLKQKGYQKVAGHFRQNNSLKNILALGGKSKETVKNWENSGEDYVYCEIDL